MPTYGESVVDVVCPAWVPLDTVASGGGRGEEDCMAEKDSCTHVIVNRLYTFRSPTVLRRRNLSVARA